MMVVRFTWGSSKIAWVTTKGGENSQYTLSRLLSAAFLADVPHPVSHVFWPALRVNETRGGFF